MCEKHNNRTWKCVYCDCTFSSRRLKLKHLHDFHSDMKTEKGGYKSPRKGKNASNNETARKIKEKLVEGYTTGRLTPTFQGRTHNEATKKRMSEKRKAYLQAHPDKIPFVLNSKAKGESYPEKYFREWLENEGIEFKQEYKFGLYSLDFLIGNINLEIDGEQHFITDKRIEHDIEREQVLQENGIQTVRVRWSHYSKLDHADRAEYLSKLKETLLSGDILPKSLVIENKQIKKIRGYCKVCGKPITNEGNEMYCSLNCYHSTYKKRDNIDKEQLLIDIKVLGVTATGRKYGVSHSTIKRWMKHYNLNK